MADRVRESLFSALSSRDAIVDTSVLDLYAGSGALSIEALSRGARDAVLVEHHRLALEACHANVAVLGFEDRARLVAADVAGFVARGPDIGSSNRFDLAFVDPPYALDDADVLAVLEHLVARWVVTDATIVVHRRGHAPPVPPGWSVGWERSFGDTLLVLVHAHS